MVSWREQFFGPAFLFAAIYASGIACKALLGFEPPALEVALGGIITLALGRTVSATYETTRVRQTAIQHKVTEIPTTAPSPTSAPTLWRPSS